MQLDQPSAVILSFPRERHMGPTSNRVCFNAGHLANLALMAIVFVLAALWLVFPPRPFAAPSATAGTTLAQELPAQDMPR